QVRVVLESIFSNVGHVHATLGSDEAILLDEGLFVFAEVKRAYRPPFVDHAHHLFQHCHKLNAILVARACQLLVALQGFLGSRHVGQGQLGIDDLDVGDGIYATSDVYDVFVFEAAHHVHDGIGLADVGQELVTKAFAFGSACYQAGDVHEFHHSWQHTFRLDDFGQGGQTRVRHLDHTDVRLNGAERIVFGGNAGLGQCVEKG